MFSLLCRVVTFALLCVYGVFVNAHGHHLSPFTWCFRAFFISYLSLILFFRSYWSCSLLFLTYLSCYPLSSRAHLARPGPPRYPPCTDETRHAGREGARRHHIPFCSSTQRVGRPRTHHQARGLRKLRERHPHTLPHTRCLGVCTGGMLAARASQHQRRDV